VEAAVRAGNVIPAPHSRRLACSTAGLPCVFGPGRLHVIVSGELSSYPRISPYSRQRGL